MPKAYVLFQNNLHDPAPMAAYGPGAFASMAAHGGTVLVGAEDYDCREGALPTRRTVILEFPSRDSAVGWYESPEYQAAAPYRRQATSEGSVVILDGFVMPGA